MYFYFEITNSVRVALILIIWLCFPITQHFNTCQSLQVFCANKWKDTRHICGFHVFCVYHKQPMIARDSGSVLQDQYFGIWRGKGQASTCTVRDSHDACYHLRLFSLCTHEGHDLSGHGQFSLEVCGLIRAWNCCLIDFLVWKHHHFDGSVKSQHVLI